MAKHTVEDVRNIALVGHGAAGKTTLADALLYKARAVDRMGSVDDGTSVSDFDDEEHKRHFSIDTSVLHADHQGKRINILDAPGYPDFVGQALGALNAVETGVIVVSATNGLEVNTRRMFNEAGRRGLARMIVINKIDADNVHFADLLKAIQTTFGKQCVPLNLPNGVGAAFSGVVSVLSPPAQVPASCPVDLAAMRSQLIDAVVESDDALMEKYLSEGEVSTEEMEKALPRAISAGTLVPILCSAGKKDKAVAELLDAVVRYAPSPSHTRPRLSQFHVGANGSAKPLEPTESTEFVGQVFKTLTDKFVGHLSFIRVLSGKIATNQNLFNLRTHKAARVAHLMEMQGKHHQDVPEAVAGDIFAVTKVDGLHIGDTVSTTEAAPRLPELHFPQPMYGLAVEPKNRGDEQKISQSLAKIADEDPTFKITHDAQTHELVITGVSQLHLDVIQHRLKRRFDLEIVTKEPKIPYRETIASEGAGDYRHKKQSGGRGQFGEVHIRIYPLSREIKTEAELLEQFANKSRFEKMRSAHYDPAHNFAFIDHIVGGTIPNQFIPAVKKGCEEMLERGVVAGYRIQDVAVEVYFGKYHDVDSSEAAFKTATRGAFKKAFQSAHPTLMEPVVKLEVTAPSKYTGALLGDLNTKRAHMENQDSLPGDLTVLMCRVPLAEVSRYAAQLGSMTQGQGTYTMEFSHYDLVPANVQQQIVSKAKMVDEDEE